jgi:hypothetical protein
MNRRLPWSVAHRTTNWRHVETRTMAVIKSQAASAITIRVNLHGPFSSFLTERSADQESPSNKDCPIRQVFL